MMMIMIHKILFSCLSICLLCFQASSFVIVSKKYSCFKSGQPLDTSLSTTSSFLPFSTSSLYLQTIFGGKGGNSNNGNNNDNNSSSSSRKIITIKANNVKIGALRFLLNIHLVGEQNNPSPKSWLCQQSDKTNNELTAYYQDGTASLTIQLLDDAIVFIRNGMKPSLQYQIQESALLHNILDELQTVAFGIVEDKEVTPDQRLLQLNDLNAIDMARSKLPIQREK